ncbi:hypothetical protein AB1Y20_022063 [Prymnesium parvum]|uniref:Uncharacterized protein n=1 Tax=Prymnesium parvum TaxID=97485 RepID=A0AB34JHQ2_PRYPA|mmetsp:Transcript_17588/g.44240  ORF Transcript_17588/g.44240 Transcript_17588/m.44240 type:complete len:280 (-) Transcript_17588:331-1170(-)
MGLTKEDALLRELEQAKAGTHARMIGEEKRLSVLTASRLQQVEQLRQLALDAVNAHFEQERAAAEEAFNHERSALQDRLVEDVVARQRRHTKMEAPELRAVTRKMRQLRGETAANASKASSKRDLKGGSNAAPLRQGEVEEDFEQMASLAAQLAPSLDIDLEIEVQPNKRLRPVEAARPAARADGPGSKRAARRGDFDFKGKPRAEVSGARITVWYEEEHGGRKMDVPYVGVVNSCDPREGLYVKFDSSPEEMLITNEDDWRWGSHSRKPPESSAGRVR